MPITDQMQANTQHAVPQNIMDVEFKLIGNLTMRQFFYLMIFSGIAYAAFTLKIPIILRWPTVVGSVLLGLGFAFVPIEDRGFDEWIVNFFRAVYQENQRIWKKEPSPPTAFLHENISIVKQELITLAPTSSRRKLEQYLTYQQKATIVDPLDIPEQAYIEKIHNAYIDYKPKATAVALEEPMVTVEPFLPPTSNQDFKGYETQPQKEEEKEEKKEEVKQKPIDEASTFKPIQVIQKRHKKVEPMRMPSDTQGSPLSPITPDRHSGRKFTNLLGSDGSVVLPIRGEKILSLESSAENAGIERDTEEKAERLKQYIAQIKHNETTYSASRNETQLEVAEAPAQVEAPIQEGKFSEDIKKQMGEMQKPTNKTDASGDTTINSANVKTEEVPVPTIPNILSGKVKDKDGKGIQNILLIIKNAHSDPVRAIKTNALGHFTISNPLPNGAYKINVDVNKETGLTFDIIDVEATGGIIQPMEFAENNMAQDIKATTQEHLDIEDIRDDLVILKNGDVAAIISTTAVNFGLLSEIEQDALIAAFAMLLNSISYPIQIVIRSKRVDISNYLTKVVQVEQALTDPLLIKQAQSYRKFIQNVIKLNNVLDKKFYVVIPSGSEKFQELGSSPFDWVGRLFGVHTKRVKVNVDQALKRAHPELGPKIEHIIGEFNRLGIKARQLSTQEIVELYFEIYNPSHAQSQRIRTDIDDYKTAIVEPAILEE